MPHLALLTASTPGRPTMPDMAAGFGTAFEFEKEGPLLRLLEWFKDFLLYLPNVRLAYVQSFARRAGCTVTYRHNSTPDEADLYLLSGTIADYRAERELLRRIYDRNRAAHVGVFGVLPTTAPEAYLDGCNFTVRGDIEAAMPRLLSGEKPSGIFDVGYAEDLDSLPLPDWQGLPLDRYRYRAITNGLVLPMLASRGCKFGCPYCPAKVYPGYRYRSVGSVIDEISLLKNRFGAKGIVFRDALFAGEREQGEGIAREMIKRGLRIPFYIETRTDTLDPAFVELLAGAGLKGIEVGVESADAELMRRNGRVPPDRKHQEEIIKVLHRHRVRVVANYIIGYEGETPESVRNTVEYACRLNTFAVQFSPITPCPGTPAFERMLGGMKINDWQDLSGWKITYNPAGMSTGQMEKLLGRAYRRYHMRPAYALRFIKSLL